ncbi:hypothetical protein [Natronospora cellulosivora (SeqCode)]
MRKNIKMSLLVLLMLIILSTVLIARTNERVLDIENDLVEKGTDIFKPVDYDNLPEGVYAQILPRMELLAGVLIQTTWINRRGPQGEGNYYFQDLHNFFSEYQDH